MEFVKKHTAWSPSKLAAYEECPLKCKLKNIDKLPEPPSEALDRGAALHGVCEQYITGRCNEKHPDLVPATYEVLDRLRNGFEKGLVKVEVEMAYTDDWKPTAWVGQKTRSRFKLDVVELDLKNSKATVIDWKTGKLKASDVYQDQLAMYGLAVLSAGWGIKEVTSKLYFLDHNAWVEGTPMSIYGLAAAQELWGKRVAPMLNDEIHAPRPGPYCRWCTWSSNKAKPGEKALCKF